jgi:hypothetical protein
VDVALAHGARLRGRLREVVLGQARDCALVVVDGGSLWTAGEATQLPPGAVLALASRALGAHAGAPSDFFPETELPRTSVPKPHTIPPREHELLGLYETSISALRSSLGSDIVPVFERVHGALCAHFPHDWLLRWNLLESLQKLGLRVPVADALRAELEQLEVHYQYRQPIASALAYLGRVARG